MTDILTPPPVDSTPQLVELIYERGHELPTYLRPAEKGAPYYDLSLVERLLAPEPTYLEEASLASPREWESLGPVYLLAGTLQTLRWSSTGEPATYQVGRVPDAASYRLVGEDHEYSLQELLDLLSRRPADFRGYPVGRGTEHRLQFTPPLADEPNSESADWETTKKYLQSGESAVRNGVSYQLYQEFNEDGSPADSYFISRRGSEGEWLTEHTRAEVESQDTWMNLVRPVSKVAA